MNKTTATVETLTARVRVLMVGSRQVTLSVARQLDEVAPDRIKPFGRICMSTKMPYASTEMIEVVGCDEDGSLVRSVENFTTYVCYFRGTPGSRHSGHAYGKPAEAIYRYCGEHAGGDYDGHYWEAAGDRWLEWAELDLIILAGLR